MVTVVAEIGINHGGNMALLREMIFKAKECGADIAKTQLYSPAKLFPDKHVFAGGRDWYPEVERAELTEAQLRQFFTWCKEAGIEPLASTFDLERLGWLEELGVKRHKAGTRATGDRQLMEAMVATWKLVYVSLAYGKPLQFPLSGRPRFLYCIPEYPASLASLHLSSVTFGKEGFYGFSDHTQGILAAQVAISRGALLVEKHFTLNRYDPSGPDHICSVEPEELKELVEFAKRVPEVL